jgi:hypothetical protein
MYKQASSDLGNKLAVVRVSLRPFAMGHSQFAVKSYFFFFPSTKTAFQGAMLEDY